MNFLIVQTSVLLVGIYISCIGTNNNVECRSLISEPESQSQLITAIRNKLGFAHAIKINKREIQSKKGQSNSNDGDNPDESGGTESPEEYFGVPVKKRFSRSSPPPSPESNEYFGKHNKRKRSPQGEDEVEEPINDEGEQKVIGRTFSKKVGKEDEENPEEWGGVKTRK